MGSGIEEVEPPLRRGIAVMRQTDPENVNLPYMLQELSGRIRRGEDQNRNESRLDDVRPSRTFDGEIDAASGYRQFRIVGQKRQLHRACLNQTQRGRKMQRI